MRQKKRMICVPTLLLLLLCIAILILTGCGMSGLKAENDTAMSSVRFVKATALAINRQQDYAEIFYAGDNPNINLEAKPFFQPSFTLKDFKASADSEDEDLIHYTCSVPGLVGTLYNMVYQTS